MTWPTYRWLCAPTGLATRRQLDALGLTTAGSEIVGEIRYGRGERAVAYLYEIATALPKHDLTPQRAAALAEAMRVRRTCTACGTDTGYCLPKRWSDRDGNRRCIDCADDDATASTSNSRELAGAAA